MTLPREAALQELCDETWPAVDQQVAVALELPGWQTPKRLRQQVIDGFLSDPSVKKYHPRNPSDRHLLAQAFQRRALSRAKATAQAVIYAVASLDDQTLKGIRTKFRIKKPKAQGKRPARLHKSDARNLELAWFVVERIMPVGKLLDSKVTVGHRGRGPKVAVPRQALAEEWNPTHPRNEMSSGDVLMGQYYRAVSRPHIAHELLTRFEQSAQSATGALRILLHTIKQGSASRATAQAREVSDFFGGHTLADLRGLADLVADYTKDYIRLYPEHREHQERTQSLPPLSEEYMRSDEYLGARREHQQHTRHLGKSKPRARKR